jgi:arylsulfatase A-like enzyme
MVVDSFDPHEPWDPPEYYRKLYDPDDDVVDVILSVYGSWPAMMTSREVQRLQGNYAGEVTMVDRWLGYFMEVLRTSGQLEDTVVAVISDHGHNLGIEPGDKGLVGKQGQPMTHAVADLVMMIRHPDGVGAGTVCDALCYNHDLTTTLMAMTGVKPEQEMDGIDLWPLVQSGDRGRGHVTVAWGPLVTVITDEWWYNSDVWAQSQLLFRVDRDPLLQQDLASDNPDVCARLHALVTEDAGGDFSDSLIQYLNRGGCRPVKEIVVP